MGKSHDCFIEDLRCEAEAMVPMRRVVDMEEYMSEVMWNELCEEESEEAAMGRRRRW